jgi:hypothetical protein
MITPSMWAADPRFLKRWERTAWIVLMGVTQVNAISVKWTGTHAVDAW